MTGDVKNSVPFLQHALENELDTKMFILRNVAKQINREGGFLQRLIPALQRDSEVRGLRVEGRGRSLSLIQYSLFLVALLLA